MCARSPTVVRSLSLSLFFGGDETLTLLSQISCSDGDATSASPFARSAHIPIPIPSLRHN